MCVYVYVYKMSGICYPKNITWEMCILLLKGADILSHFSSCRCIANNINIIMIYKKANYYFVERHNAK